jgi:protein phosphatase
VNGEKYFKCSISMAVELKERHKIDYANISHRGVRRRENNDGFGKFPDESSDLNSPKGQLFIIADAKTANPVGGDAAKMAIRIIQENYFSYPSNDITFSLQRAFDIANRQLYQYAKANGLQRKFGATCSALVLTDPYAYVAHVGDCRVYRIGSQKIEQLTKDHTRILKSTPENHGHNTHPMVLRKSCLTRALGVKLGIKVDVKHLVAVHSDEYFLLCSDGLKNITDKEIQEIVLTLPPQEACNKLIEVSRERGSDDDTTVQIVKFSHQEPEKPAETFSQTTTASTRQTINWPLYGIMALFLLVVGFLGYEPAKDILASFFGGSLRETTSFFGEEKENSAALMADQQLFQAAEHLEKRQWDKALQIYLAILQKNSENAEAKEGVDLVAGAYQAQGDRAYRQRKWEDAQANYQRLLALRPGDNELSSRVKECSQLIEREKSAVLRTHEDNPSDTGNESSASPEVDLLVESFNSARWEPLGLYQYEDYRLQPENVIFFDNLKVKKVFCQRPYETVDMSVNAKVLSGSGNGKYGIIFAHNAVNTPKYQNFYLFTIDNAGHFALHKVAGTQVQTIVSEVIKPGIIGSSGQVYLRLKAFNNVVLMYANGELLKMVTIAEQVKGEVGLYVDPKLSVEFSRIKVSPAEN